MKNNVILKNDILVSSLLFLAVSLLLTLVPEFALAGTGGEELQEVYEATESMISGYYSKIVALLSFGGALLAGFKGNYGAGLSALAVSVVAGVGPTMLTSGISALI